MKCREILTLIREYRTVLVGLWVLVLSLINYVTVIKQSSRSNGTVYSSMWCYTSRFGIQSRDDLKCISTSCFNLSNFYLNIAIVKTVREYELIQERTIIMSRFKPDNIMHVIHDDLIPLYVTYQRICLGKVEQCASKTVIIFFDNIDSRFLRLYKAFSYKPPFSLRSFRKITCFSDVTVGLDSDSIFYQYGFNKHQGSLQPLVSGNLYYEFSEYILKNLEFDRELTSKCTLIGRVHNRKILNEKYLAELVKYVHTKETNENIFVKSLDINAYPIEQVIGTIVKSKLLLGMHGAGMILAIFLPQDSLVIELFPYGISKENVSPLYSLSNLSGIHFRYNSWTNQNKNNTLGHPEYPRLLGGFEGISESQKIQILSATDVPAVYCCHEPLYLYFMYQDTYVDFSIVKILEQSFKSNKSFISSDSLYEKWFFPDQVRNIKCYINNTFAILNWDPPTNINNFSDCVYKITLSSSIYNTTYITKFSFLKFIISVKDKNTLIWIRCAVNGVNGSDSHFVCHK